MPAFDTLGILFYVNNVLPTQQSVLADFTISDNFDTAIALDDLVGPVLLPSGAMALRQTIQAVAGAEPTGETIYGGILVTIGTPNILRGVLPFGSGNQVVIAQQYQNVVFDVVLPIAGNQTTGLEA